MWAYLKNFSLLILLFIITNYNVGLKKKNNTNLLRDYTQLMNSLHKITISVV